MNNCDLHGCIYNEDGECVYDNSDIKIPYNMACYDRDHWSDERVELQR